MGCLNSKQSSNITDKNMFVILPISNPMNFKSREKRFNDCLNKLKKTSNIDIIVIRLKYDGDLSVQR